MVIGLPKMSRAKIFKDITRIARIETETLQPKAKVAMPEVFCINAAAPGVIVSKKTIECSFVTGDERTEEAILAVFRTSKCVRAPKAHVYFVLGVPFRARRRSGSHLLHLLAGITFRSCVSHRGQRTHRN